MRRHGLMACVAAALLAGWLSTARAQEYEIGGPLAGVKLPLFPTQFGEKPGYPGCIPELMAQGQAVQDMGNEYREWGPQGLAPEWDLYAGSVEHWRAYMFKYMPIRSFFDGQSQVKNWAAPDIPGAEKGQVEEYASPVYWVPRHAAVQDTGRKLKPVPVVRMKVKSPVFQLDLGELPESMYAVRLIGAVETDKLRAFRRPLFVRARINDGNDGEATEYKKRIGYCDEFYSVCEFYFNAPVKRAYRAEVWVDEGSEVDLLVHNVSLDDVLAGATRSGVKTRVTVAVNKERPQEGPSKYGREERLARDAALWNYLPPLNHQGSGNTFRQASYNAIFPPDVQFGAEGKTQQQIEADHGAWTGAGVNKPEGFLVNPKLQLEYTRDDMVHYRPLPDPYPYKDDGTGLYFPDANDPGKGTVLAEVGIEVMNRVRSYPTMARAAAQAWRDRGDVDAARDGAIVLARYAYIFPSINSADYLCNLSRDPGAYGRNLYNRRRESEAMFMTHYANYLDAPTSYDGLFDYIQGNQELAESIGRFVPWVKTSEDVVRLIDTYLVEMTAKRILRYHYHTNPTAVAELAAILGPGPVTDPWLEWLFSRTFVYPMPPGGVQDLMISGCDRSGPQYIGSTYYAQGEGALHVAKTIQRFKDLGILPGKYDLTNAEIFPKPLANCYWHLDIIMGGLDFCRIGDVGGPDKAPGMTLGSVAEAAGQGWKWSRDPKFAWVLKNRTSRKGYTDEEWAEIERAAATVPRAPWLDNRSRQVYNWFGALETAVEKGDFAARRGAYVRVGAGIGHQHDDSMDLQFYAHGLPMTVDGGQRPGYCTPGDRSARVHNTVVAEGRSGLATSWVRCLSDAEGARYMSVDGPPIGETRLFRRNVALIDVAGAEPASYIFDVFRVGGGAQHSYCFHGPITDEVTTNALDVKPVAAPAAGQEAGAEAQYLRIFGRSQDSWLAGDAPDILETTWRYSRERGPGSEMSMLGNRFNAASPRKFTRLHLFDAAGARVLRADAVCYQWKYKYNCQMVRKQGQDLQSAFTAVYEPFAGEPFIAERKSVPIADNEADALRAVAVEITTKSGQKDLCFSDGRPEKVRRVGEVEVAGEFAYVSVDGGGLRQAALTGGALLKAPGLEIRTPQREYTGRVVAAEYLKRTLKVDGKWPTVCSGGILEIAAPGRTTSYTSASVQPQADGTVVFLTRGADYFRSQVERVDAGKGLVSCQVTPALGAMAGLNKDFVASNDSLTKLWRADELEGGVMQLRGGPSDMADFKPEGALRLWEYGVGDTARMSTFVGLRRLEPGVFELTGNVDVEVSLAGAPARRVTAEELAKNNGLVQIRAGQ